MMNTREFVEATKASYKGEELAFTGITTDSRAVQQGELFLALVGGNFDGHNFCRQALESGAVAVVVSHLVEAVPIEKQILVQDTLVAYQQAAAAYRNKCAQAKGLKVIGITGSNGKTSTKDLLAACLSTKYKVVKTQANYNNEIGLPKTLFTIKEDTDIAVVEMGMRGLGQIRELCQIAHPDSGIISNVGETHMELLGSMDNIGLAKSEIVEDLPAEGYAVLNGDNAYVRRAAGKTKAKVIYFGLGEDCDYRGSEITTSCMSTSFTCTEKATDKSVRVRLQLMGEHNVYNALSALATAAAYGVDMEEAAKALATARLTSSRQEIVYIGDLTFINDAYNASPASMEAALKTLAEAGRSSGNARTIAVLADMLELGAVSEGSHINVGRQAWENKISYLLTYGKEAKYISDEFVKLGGSGQHCADRQEAAAVLRTLATAGDIILLKGSNSMQVGKLLELFK